MQIKTTMKYCLTLVRLAIHNKSTNSRCCWGCRKKGTFMHCWWECRLVQPLWKAVWRYLQKLKMNPSFDPVVPLPGIHPKEPKTLIWKNISTTMFIAVLFTITKIWKQPKCPSIHEWIKTTMGCLPSGIVLGCKKKKILPFVTAWMDLGKIMLSEISQS